LTYLRCHANLTPSATERYNIKFGGVRMSDVMDEDKTMGLITHISGIFTGFIGPLVIWLINKDKTGKEWLIAEAKESLNFQITVAIAYVICSALMFVLIGMLLFPLVWIAAIVLSIMGGLKAKDGTSYRYPFALRLIK
jgi:uncharacterized protein